MTQSPEHNPPRVEFQVRFRTGQHGRRCLSPGVSRKEPDHLNNDLPRLTRLLALAHRWNRLIEEGVVANHAEIAHMMGLSRARVTQIMDLRYLAPVIQNEILFAYKRKLEIIPERTVRPITRLPTWNEQCKVWVRMKRGVD